MDVSAGTRRELSRQFAGHLKTDHRMGRCHLKGTLGDEMHAVLCAAGYYVRWPLRMIERKGLRLLCVHRAMATIPVRGEQQLGFRSRVARIRLGHRYEPTRYAVAADWTECSQKTRSSMTTVHDMGCACCRPSRRRTRSVPPIGRPVSAEVLRTLLQRSITGIDRKSALLAGDQPVHKAGLVTRVVRDKADLIIRRFVNQTSCGPCRPAGSHDGSTMRRSAFNASSLRSRSFQ